MNIQIRKMNFIQEFLRLNSEDVISKLDKVLQDEKKKIYNKEVKPMSTDEFNHLIFQAHEDVVNYKVVEAKQLKKDLKQWK